jgi:hypothetical protein
VISAGSDEIIVTKQEIGHMTDKRTSKSALESGKRLPQSIGLISCPERGKAYET